MATTRSRSGFTFLRSEIMTHAHPWFQVKIMCIGALLAVGLGRQAHAQTPQPGVPDSVGNAAETPILDEAAKPQAQSGSWLAAHEAAMLGYLEEHPKLRDLILKPQGHLPRPLAEYVNNKVGSLLKKIIIMYRAFAPTGNVTPSGRLVVLTLANRQQVLTNVGDRVEIVVTVTQASTGASASATWHTVAGARRSPEVAVVVPPPGGRTFEPGPGEATGALTRTDRFGRVVETFRWSRTVTLKKVPNK
jgi:hypothetical protein